MKNWEEIYENLGTQKYNRNVFLYYIREATFLETKKIRESIKKFRDIYKNTKQSFLLVVG
jgi:hypothetical protein